MKVFVSTKRTQGQRKSDFSYVPEGELLYFAFECESDRGNADGGCGCQRSFAGMECNLSTTTATVTDLPITEAEFIEKYLKANESWLELDPQLKKGFTKEAKEMLELASTDGHVCRFTELGK